MSHPVGSRQWRKLKWSDVRMFYESGKACAQTASTWTGLPLKEVQSYYDRRDELAGKVPELYPHQKRAVEALKNYPDAVLTVTKGYGKTSK